ncbi:MAG: DUF3575 domain-containing protein [Bacteroidales bacterium]|nr:DUF3575 domain-containing protein [Bacteroidales bacterium]
MKNIILSIALLLLLCLTHSLFAQELSLSTNLLDWANLGTANLQAGYSFGRHASLHAGVRYNNWNYGSAERRTAFQNRARTLSAGARYWPWSVYSSWWFGMKAQVEEYNRGGLLRRAQTEEGVAAGLGLALGYSRMLSEQWNLDLGVGFWGGKTWFTQYRCPRCGRIRLDEDGDPVRDATKWFLLPSNDLQISLTYIF